MLSPEELFVRRFDEINAGLRARDDFDRLKTASALRQLLLDGSPLLHEVNRTRKLKIQFVVNNVGTSADFSTPPDLLFHGRGLDPSGGQPVTGTRTVNLDQFLSTPVVESPTGSVTVKDIIGFIANKAGGVHFDSSRSRQDAKLEELLGTVSRFGIDSVAASLDAIARITLSALSPLRRAIVQLPSEIRLFAHYALETGRIDFDGREQLLATDLSQTLKDGWGLHAIIRVMRQAQPGERILYDLGNPSGSAPRITLLTDDAGDLIARIHVDEGLVSELRAVGYRGTALFNRFTYIAMELAYSDEVTSRLFVNNRLVASDRVIATNPPRLVTRQSLGADLLGGRHATFQIQELVLADMTLDDALRARLAHYFWLQWHG
jgi:hypothetical protein